MSNEWINFYLRHYLLCLQITLVLNYDFYSPATCFIWDHLKIGVGINPTPKLKLLLYGLLRKRFPEILPLWSLPQTPMTSRLICAISVFVNISHPVPELNHYLFPGKGVTFPEWYSNYLLRQHSRTSKDPSPLLLWKLGMRNRLSTALF